MSQTQKTIMERRRLGHKLMGEVRAIARLIDAHERLTNIIVKILERLDEVEDKLDEMEHDSE